MNNAREPTAKPPLTPGSAWAGGKPNLKPATKPSLNPFLFTREALLEMFSLSFELPKDTNKEILVFHTEPRNPLAFVPLSDQEKRVISYI